VSTRVEGLGSKNIEDIESLSALSVPKDALMMNR
jgi:hypothetical protein